MRKSVSNSMDNSNQRAPQEVALVEIGLHVSRKLERVSPGILSTQSSSSAYLALTAALGNSLNTIRLRKALSPVLVRKRQASLCLYLTASASKA